MTPLTKLEKYKLSKLHKQLDFFGCNRKRFISVYANKPRIRVGAKPKEKPVPLISLLRAKHKILNDSSDLKQPERSVLEDLYMRYGLRGISGYAASEARARQATAQAMAQRQAMDYQRMQYDRLRNVGMSSVERDIQSQFARLDQLPGQGQRSSLGGLGGTGQASATNWITIF